MSARPFVSVKFSPIGRSHTFLMPELDLDAEPAALSPGDQVVVQTEAGPALGTVTRPIPDLLERKPPDASAQVVRRATRDENG